MTKKSIHTANILGSLIEDLKEDVEKLSPLLTDQEILLEIKEKFKTIEDYISEINGFPQVDNSIQGLDVANLLAVQSELEESKTNLLSQFENTDARIWSIDKNFIIKTINSNFNNDFKAVFGINLTIGMNLIQNLPEPFYSAWKDRFFKAMQGERFTVVDVFKIREEEKCFETCFNPILFENEVFGVSCFSSDITARKQAENDHIVRAKELDSIFENAPIIFLLIDEKGQVINTNYTGEINSGKVRLDNLGLLSKEVMHCVNALNKPDGCGKGSVCQNCAIRNTINSTFQLKQNQHQVEGTLTIEKNGLFRERIYMISTTYFCYDQKERVLVSIDDVTDIKEAEEKIHKLSAAVEQSRATIVITDIKGNIEYANPQFSKTTGYQIDEVIGQNPRLLKSNKTSSSEYNELWKTILKGKTWQGEFLNITKDKKEYWESAIISPIFNKNHEIISFIAIKEDITERKRIQQELINSEQELRLMNEEKTRFFSILAHDLRGLVGNNHAFSDLLFSNFDTYSRNELKENMQVLVNSTKDSLVLLDNLLDWSKATMGKISIVPQKINLFEQANKVVEIMTELALKKSIRIHNEIDKSIVTITDSNVFQTIIRNLINNSIKFTLPGGKISVRAVAHENKDIEVSVSDTGVGMDKATLEKLFNPWEKVATLGTNMEIGTGLGLMICDEMAKKLGSKIQVESKVGKGSRFFFALPVLMD